MQTSDINKKTVLLAMVCLATIIASGQEKDNGFTDFWLGFRMSVLKNEFKKLDSLTLFPLIMKGTLDNDPVQKIGPKNFPVAFKKYLSRSNFNMSGTELDDIKIKTVFSAAEYIEMKTNQIRISDMVFKKIKGRWLMYLIYIDTE